MQSNDVRATRNPGGIHSNSFHLFISALIAVFVLSCHQGSEQFTAQDVSSLNRWLDTARTPPSKPITELLASGHSVVFAQDDVLRKDSVLLMKALLPSLQSVGVNEIGVFFLNRARQKEIDAFIQGAREETPALKTLFAGNIALGYVEYWDFLLYIRDFNALMKPGENPIRLIALGEGGTVNAETLAGALGYSKASNHSVDANPSEVNSISRFLWISALDAVNLPAAPNAAADDARGGKPALVVHHGPDKKDLRWGGLIEFVTASRDIRDRSFGFRAEEAPFAAWRGNESGIDADIYLVTSYPYQAVSPIPDFINTNTAEAAQNLFPEITMRRPTRLAILKMNRIIRQAARAYRRKLDRLKMPE